MENQASAPSVGIAAFEPGTQPRSVGIRSVANRANVSPAVVSKLLRLQNTDIGVSKGVCERVYTAAREMNYRPNNMLGLVCEDNFLELRLMSGVLQEASARNMPVVRVDRDSVTRDMDRLCLNTNVRPSGIISSWAISQERLKVFERVNIPSVIINPVRDYPTNAVICDDYAGMVNLLKAMKDAGTDRFAYISRFWGATIALNKRVSGYDDFCREEGISVYKSDFETWGRDRATPEDLLEWISSDKRSFAIVSGSRLVLVEMYSRLSAMGLRYTTDYELAVFGAEIKNCWTLPLWCVDVPYYDMGRAAVEMITRRWNGENEQESVTLVPRILTRER